MSDRVAFLKAIAGEGDLDERCTNLARYYWGPPPAPPPRSSLRPLSLRQRAAFLLRLRRRAARARANP